MAIQSDQEFVPSQIARATFPTAFRGYDQDAVRRYLSRLAAELEQQQEYADLGNLEARTPAHNRVEELEEEIESLNEEVRQLEVELVQRSLSADEDDQSAQTETGSLFGDRPSKSRADVESDDALDESRAIEFLGQETARVLESARSAASDILKRAEGQAKAMERQAREHLADARARAEALVADKQAKIEALVEELETEAEASAAQMKLEAEQHHAMVLEESAKIMLEAEASGEAERERSQERAREIVADAETLRQQVVAELVVERRAARVELEQMGAARDRVAMSLSVARSELNTIAEDLERSSLPVFQSGVQVEVEGSDVTVSGASLDQEGGGVDDGESAISNSDHDLTVETPIEALAESDEQLAENDDPTDVFELEGHSVQSNGVRNTDNDVTGEVEVTDLLAEFDEQDSGLDAASADADEIDGDLATNSTADTTAANSNAAKSKVAKSKAANSKAANNKASNGKATNKAANGKRSTKKSTQKATAVKKGGSKNKGTASKSAVSKSPASKNRAKEKAPTIEGPVGEESGGKSAKTRTEKAFDTGRDQFDELLDDLGIHSDAEPGLATIDLDSAEIDNEQMDLVDTELVDETVSAGLDPDSLDSDDLGEESVNSQDPNSDNEEVENAKATSIKANQAMAMVDGFTTIELVDEAIDLDELDAAELADDEEGSAASVQHSVIVSEPESPESIITTVTARATPSLMEGNRGDIELDEPTPGKAPPEFSARDLALTRSGPDLRRQLRRALNDDQSDVLDRLRAGRREIEVSELPAFGDQIDRYLSPLRRSLGEVAEAGAAAGGQSELSPRALDNLVRQLAKFIVDQVRIPTVEAVSSTEDDDREKILEPIRAIYRDFRNGGLPGLAEDALYEAFAIGLYDSIEPAERLAWKLDPRTDPDPVCEINAANSDVMKGMTFPSGHSRPLAMPGCRCLVVSADFWAD